MNNTEIKKQILNNKTAHFLFKRAVYVMKHSNYWNKAGIAAMYCVEAADVLKTNRVLTFLIAAQQSYN